MPQKFHTSQDMAIPPFIPLKPTLSWQVLMDRSCLTDVKQRVEINGIENEFSLIGSTSVLWFSSKCSRVLAIYIELTQTTRVEI